LERELEVFKLVSAGLSNREIGNKLGLSAGTVKNYVTTLLQKIGVRDRTQVALRVRELGLIWRYFWSTVSGSFLWVRPPPSIITSFIENIDLCLRTHQKRKCNLDYITRNFISSFTLPVARLRRGK
jgi:DNA-binding CsgD family transcriptional regulator